MDVSAFHTDGFLHLHDIFSDRVGPLREALANEPTRHGVHAWPEWNEVATDARLLHFARACLGAEPVLHQSIFLVKQPLEGESFPPHQDGAYFGSEFPVYVIAYVYLDDVTPDNGSIGFVPGSHLTGLLPHERDRHGGDLFVPLQEYGMDRLVVPEALQGDVVIYGLWTVHGSAPNRSDRLRRAVRLGYTAKQ